MAIRTVWTAACSRFDLDWKVLRYRTPVPETVPTPGRGFSTLVKSIDFGERRRESIAKISHTNYGQRLLSSG